MRWFKTPFWASWLMPNRIWRGPRHDSQGRPCVYLTFDDGPIPEVTPWVLDQLEAYGAKATFFSIGDNAMRYPEILQDILKRGHTVGNHTQSHCKGSETSKQVYLEQVQAFHNTTQLKTSLFRPPYGRITSSQASSLSKLGYRIVMWDILSYDWEKELSAQRIYARLKKHLRPGSIVVFHDSLKAEKNLRAVLPQILEYCNNEEMVMAALKQD